MLNEKMQGMALAIESIINETFPKEYLQFVFDGKITRHDLVSYILFDGCKYAYDKTLPKKSLLGHLKDIGADTDDSERMMYQRILHKVNDYRKNEYEIRKEQSGLEIHGLLSSPMQSMQEKSEGYKLNDFQFWELKNIHDMRLVFAIINGRMSNKNFNNETFKEYASEYDSTILELMDQMEISESDLVFSSLALFTLEWKYAFDFYYEVAKEMERSKIDEIPDLKRRCSLFCGPVAVDSILNSVDLRYTNGRIHTDSRMVLLRKKFVQEFVNLPKGDEYCRLKLRYTEALVIICVLLQNRQHQKNSIMDWFVKNTSMPDWASVMTQYNVCDSFIKDKSWTNKRIRYVKNIYTELQDLRKS